MTDTDRTKDVVDGTTTVDLGMRYATHRELRRWEPGDGLSCTYAARASRSRPCGPPVAVRLHTCHANTEMATKRKEVVCAYHLADWSNPGDLRVRAEVQAREQVLVAHWGEYQDAIEGYMNALVRETIGNLPEELKLLVLDALARHDQPPPADPQQKGDGCDN